MIRVSIDPAPIELALELAALEERGAGGVASFTGVVRGGDGITALELEHYPGMTGAQGCQPADQISDVADRFGWIALLLPRPDPFADPGEIEQVHQVSMCLRPTRR
jgi:molybdopterin synthase catalytic subunit